MLTKQIDFTTLEEQVMEKWIDDGAQFDDQQLLTSDPYPIYEPCIKSEFAAILDDPMACIAELGYDSIASYLADQDQAVRQQAEEKRSVIFMSGVLSKRFREQS